MYYYPYYFDPTYILVLIGVIICALASANVRRIYSKYENVRSQSGMTGYDAARKILYDANIYDVQVTHIGGDLTDNYNPSRELVSLSDSTYNSTSIAAIGVAAHECGHVLQYHEGYFPIRLRNTIVPVVNIGAKLSWPIIILGVLISMSPLITFGIILFSFTLIFQLVTLPVEFNASSRALQILKASGTLTPMELKGAKDVLNAAALTYVAASFATLLQLLRLVMIFGGRRNRR